MGFESVRSREVNVDLNALSGERRHLKGPGEGVGFCGDERPCPGANGKQRG